MPAIYDWTARRSGAHLTVTGVDAGGNAVKLTEVDEISSAAAYCVAVKADGNSAFLASMSMPKLYGWTAERFGTTLTVLGRDVGDKVVELQEITHIHAIDGAVVAFRGNLRVAILVVAPPARPA